MRFSFLSLILLPLLYILNPALVQAKSTPTLDRERAASLFADGTSLFSPTEGSEDTNGIKSRWILFGDEEEKITRIWDNTRISDIIGVVVSDEGAWVFIIPKDYHKQFFSAQGRYQATFIYESDDFYTEIAYPLFGHADPRGTPPLPGADKPSRSPHSLSAHKTTYRRAFILSGGTNKNTEIISETFITALAWAMTYNTGLDVQWLGRTSNKLVSKQFVFRRQPNHEHPENADIEIFYAGLRLLTGTVISSKLSVSQYSGFTLSSFRKMADETPDRITVVNTLWSRYPNVVKELGFKKDGPKARTIMWKFDLGEQATIYRHLNNDDQENSIFILVVTTAGSWILTLSTEYMKKFARAKSVQGVQKSKTFKQLQKDILMEDLPETGKENIDSWDHAANRFSFQCSGVSLIEIAVLSGFTSGDEAGTLVQEPLIKAVLLAMTTTSPAAAVLLDGLEKRDIPFYQFPKKSRDKARRPESARFIMRHYTSPSLADEDGNLVGEGEFFECYFGTVAIVKAGSGEFDGQLFYKRDPQTGYLSWS